MIILINKVKSIASAGLSGFFAPHIVYNLAETGAIGGGLGISNAVEASVAVELAKGNGITIVNKVNGEYLDGCIAKYIAEKILTIAGVESCRIFIDQKISVPIGGGYGTSGGSAVAIAFALAKALDITVDFNEIAEIAHEADIICKCGLGTVVGIIKPCNGIVLVVKPGGPKVAEVRCIPIKPRVVALTAFYRPIPKNTILTNTSDLEKVKNIGIETLKRIEKNPTPENFIENCYWFAVETKLMTHRIRQIIDTLKKVDGFLGGSMNMVGEAFFTLVEEKAVEEVLAIVKKSNPLWVNVWSPSVGYIRVEKIEKP